MKKRPWLLTLIALYSILLLSLPTLSILINRFHPATGYYAFGVIIATFSLFIAGVALLLGKRWARHIFTTILGIGLITFFCEILSYRKSNDYVSNLFFGFCLFGITGFILWYLYKNSKVKDWFEANNQGTLLYGEGNKVISRTFKTRLLPCDLGDWLVSLTIALIFILVATLLMILFGVILKSPENVSALIALSLVTFSYLLIFFYSKVTLDDSGIRFQRTLWKSKFIVWNDVVHLEETPVKEVILKSRFFPFIFSGISMFSLKHHIKIVYRGNKTIFVPVKEFTEFLSLAQSLKNSRPAPAPSL